MEQFLVWLDPFFVLPYRMVPQPEAAYFLGTAILALVAGLIGIATLRMAQRMHRKRLKKLQDDMRHYHELSESALQNSGKEAFKAVNRQGHDVNAHCKGTHHVHAKVTHLWGLCARTQSGVLTRGGREA